MTVLFITYTVYSRLNFRRSSGGRAVPPRCVHCEASVAQCRKLFQWSIATVCTCRCETRCL